jgi:hypothetical protein
MAFKPLQHQSTMNKNLIPQRESECVEEVIEGEIVLYAVNAEKAFYLNESSALIWQLIDGQRSIEQIESLLTDAYPEAVSLQEDLMDALEKMRTSGVVRL